MNKNSVIIMVVVAVLVGGAAFYGGMQFQKTQRGVAFGANGMRRFGAQGGIGAGGSGGIGSRAVRGEVLSNDGKTVTVKLADGSTKLILVSSTTVITEATKASDSALIQGKQVMVFGTDNADGSVSAQNVSIGEIGGFGGRVGGVRPTGE
jgi:hypothetical protein